MTPRKDAQTTRMTRFVASAVVPAQWLTSTGLFISPSGTSELDCATTKKDTAERSISIGRESLKVFVLY